MCWAKGDSFERHIFYTHDIVERYFGSELALMAMRHHWGSSYDRDYRPKKDEEWIVGLADKIATGADRPEKGQRVKIPPVKMSFPLSKGEIVHVSSGKDDLWNINADVERRLEKVCNVIKSDLSDGYRVLYDELERSLLVSVPADTRPPFNDHSLWDHLKMTAAFATCMCLECVHEGRFLGREPDNYEFALIGGDADRVSVYINRSLRLPDLRAGSEMVKKATDEVARVIRERLGPECVIFAGGGNFLALSPSFMADELMCELESRFEELMEGELGITVRKMVGSGEKFKEEFGGIWASLRGEVRVGKMKKLIEVPQSIVENRLCDICGLRPATHEDPLRLLPYDARPRFERLCDVCFKRRDMGRRLSGPTMLDELADDNGYVAVIRADGDGIGEIFSGERLSEYGKRSTPSRLAFFSRYVNEVCERELRDVASKYGSVIYAGGDDILAIIKGKYGFDCAFQIREKFEELMHGRVTISVGLVVIKKVFPIYVALEVAEQLLKNAKRQEGKGSIDFSVVYQVGVTRDDVSFESRMELRRKGLTHRPYKWADFERFLKLLKSLRAGTATSQLRRVIEMLSLSDPYRFERAELFVKSQMGRGLIDYETGMALLNDIRSGVILDVASVFKRVG